MLKKSIAAHWKLFIKEDEKEEKEVFYGEDKKKGGYKGKPKKRFKGDCRNCGKQGHKSADCRSKPSGEAPGKGGGDKEKNKNVTCYNCQEKGHYARECPKKKKNEEFGLFCGMIAQEEKEDEDSAQENLGENEDLAQGSDGEEWHFMGVAAAFHLEAKEAKKVDEDEKSDDSCPSLIARIPREVEEEDESDDDSMPDLVNRNWYDDESDDDSMPDLVTKNWYDDASSGDEEEEDDENCVFNNEEVNFSDGGSKNAPDDGKIVVKWLLDTDASIKADTAENSVQNEKPCNSTINIADGNAITPRGVGTKTILDHKSGYPLRIKKMHVIPEFAKRILSVATLIDDGYQVSFQKAQAIIKDKSGKEIECPRDKISGL